MDNKKVIEIIGAGLAFADWNDEQREAFIIAGEAVKKQIAISRDIRRGKYYCPICKKEAKKGYCSCGQKLY